MKYFWNFCITPQPCQSHFCCWLLPFSAQKSSLGQIGSNQQQKWLWHGWGVMQKFQNYFISLILTYKVRKKTYLLHCTAKQAGTVHKLHFQPKNPARAKLTAINNKIGGGTTDLSPKIQLGPNWQQLTTKMAVARLKYNVEILDIIHIIDNIIYGQEKDRWQS